MSDWPELCDKAILIKMYVIDKKSLRQIARDLGCSEGLVRYYIDKHGIRTHNKIVAGDGDPRHGTLSGYKKHACRCPLCREAKRVKIRQYNAQRRYLIRKFQITLADNDPRHGTTYAYQMLLCRCSACKSANTASQASYRARAKANKNSCEDRK